MIQIINPSNLVNGYILNDVAHFTQSTNPTTRIDGSALVVGDKLYRTDLRRDYYWNGVSSWVSEQLFTSAVFSAASIGGSTTFWSSLPHIDAIIWVEFIAGTARFIPTIIGDRWDCSLIFRNSNDANVLGSLGSLDWISPNLITYTYFSKVAVGSLLNLPASDAKALVSTITKTGSSGGFSGQINIAYRLVA